MMLSPTATRPPSDLRARIAADLAPVTPLAPPLRRLVWVLPFAALALLAAPFWFEVREDAARLGWAGTWGLSLGETAFALALIAAALREAVPGRGWSPRALATWLGGAALLVGSITWTTWWQSPVTLNTDRAFIAALCFAGSLVSALPIVAVAAILAARAFPLRPVTTGLLAGLGAGLAADAGWRLFCHFSEPAHVFLAHAGGVATAALAGAVAVRLLTNRER